MPKTVQRTVHVTDDAGEVHVLERGQEVPRRLEEFITNPKVYEPDPEDLDALTDEEIFAAAGGNAVVDPGDGADGDEYSELNVRGLAALAQEHDVDITGMRKRAELVQALRDAGVAPPEEETL